MNTFFSYLLTYSIFASCYVTKCCGRVLVLLACACSIERRRWIERIINVYYAFLHSRLFFSHTNFNLTRHQWTYHLIMQCTNHLKQDILQMFANVYWFLFSVAGAYSLMNSNVIYTYQPISFHSLNCMIIIFWNYYGIHKMLLPVYTVKYNFQKQSKSYLIII